MRRRNFLKLLCAGLLIPVTAESHSPWGQYQVYRQKHLMILSTRDDKPSYPLSKQIVAALQETLPSADARPARAKHMQRAYDLLRTGQFHFALLSSDHIKMMREGSGIFEGKAAVELELVYSFGDMQLVVLSEFPDELVSAVAHGVLDAVPMLPEADKLDRVLANPLLHPAAASALKE